MLNHDGRPNPVLQQSKFPLITKILGYSDPRIDLTVLFIKPSSYLEKTEYHSYKMDQQFYEAKPILIYCSKTTLILIIRLILSLSSCRL
jgi:hypothetical protein